MTTLKRLTGAALFAYASLYVMQGMFSTLYEPYFPSSDV